MIARHPDAAPVPASVAPIDPQSSLTWLQKVEIYLLKVDELSKAETPKCRSDAAAGTGAQRPRAAGAGRLHATGRRAIAITLTACDPIPCPWRLGAGGPFGWAV